MDRVYMAWRAQDPVFWVDPRLAFTFRPKPKAQALFVGHRGADEGPRWYVQRIPIDGGARDATAEFGIDLPVGGLKRELGLVTPETLDAVLRALDETDRKTSAIRDREPWTGMRRTDARGCCMKAK